VGDENADSARSPAIASRSGAVAIIGGTGKLGTALATRFAHAGHEVIIGSRDAARAQAAAAALAARLGVDTADRVRGLANTEAAVSAEIVVVAVPFEGQSETLRELAPAIGSRIVISTAVPLRMDETGPVHVDVPEGSATEQVASLLPTTTVVGALHTVSSATLRKLDRDVDADVIITGDNPEAKEAAAELLTALSGVRVIDGGPLRNSRYIEQLTVLLLSINMRHHRHTGIRVTDLPDELAMRLSADSA
jgi:NADPH-dependent F420 reductase